MLGERRDQGRGLDRGWRLVRSAAPLCSAVPVAWAAYHSALSGQGHSQVGEPAHALGIPGLCDFITLYWGPALSRWTCTNSTICRHEGEQGGK